MSWTRPKTYTAGDLIGVSDFNRIRDNEQALADRLEALEQKLPPGAVVPAREAPVTPQSATSVLAGVAAALVADPRPVSRRACMFPWARR